MDLKKIYNLLYKSFVTTLHPRLCSIKHENGKLYASDGHILAIVQCEYPEDREGNSYEKDGSLITNNDTKYESVIPGSYTDDVKFTNRIDDLRAGVKKVYRLGKGIDKALIDTELTRQVGSDDPERITFPAHHIYAAFQLFDILKEDFTIRISSGSMRCMMIESLYSESRVLIMPVFCQYPLENITRPVFTIEEALNYKPEVKSESKAWYE